MEHDVFISYSSKNKAAADAICHVLENNGIKCWMAPRDIPAGTEYGDLIDSAIKAAKVMVVVFSETAAKSSWVKGEMNIAFEEQKVIIPYRIDPTPFSGQNRVILNQKHWIDAYPDYQTKFTDLVDAVCNALGREKCARVPSSIDTKDKRRRPNSKLIAGIVVFVVVAAAITLSILYITKGASSYSYNKNGLHIEGIKGLDANQQTALTEILDNMVAVDGGSFVMGNNYAEPDYLTELDSLSIYPHKVNLSSFYISKYELNQRDWQAFVDLAGCILQPGENKAVDNISWEEAKEFADRLSSLTGLSFSLPTEAQWEYAAGGGEDPSRTIFAGFSDGANHYAWTVADNLNSAATPGEKLPNKLGLYDMTGNVGEWCVDDFRLYSPEEASDPAVISDGNKKIYRGGDFTTPNLADMKITTRYYAPPFAKREATGLRLVINKPSAK